MAKRRYRILFIQRPLGGGSATGLEEIIRVMDRSRFQPVVLFHEPNPYVASCADLGAEVFVLSEAKKARKPNVTSGTPVRGNGSHRPAAAPLGFWPTVQWIRRLVREQDIDLIHHNNNPSGNRVSILAASLTRKPQICHVRFLVRYRPVDRWLSRFIDHYIHVSHAIARQCEAGLRLPAARGEVIHDSVDFDRFAGASAAAERVRSEFGFGPADCVITNVGRLVAWKGQDVMLRAVAEIASSRPEVKVLIVGAADGSEASKSFLDTLQKLTVQLGLEDRVLFTGFRTDVAEIMAASDIVVHTATKPEPFGRVITETLATGRPVIATAAGGVFDIIRNGVTGMLVPPGNVAALARALLDLLANPTQADHIGAAGQRHVRREFSQERFGRAINRVYERLLELKRKRA